MATIGTFTKTENGYTGSVKTLNLNAKAQIVAVEKDNERSPDYRVYSGTIEIGAGWTKTARESNRDYVSLKLDDPSLPAPIFGSLVQAEDSETYNLIWSRRPGE
ncbi:DUF736 domain-containing protein [Asticcacaulis sp. EMRT-3]|uniref:DUF736 domain-containing protein n=1 Tax=Asticcacaulis sp. EMRT-3 TaxID=3040349 RepID=UPI0024AFE970|nr:DUF736 domain-containing protein [Asticcacaulis sp. EMRT-3]MDI7776585.1 DUF736 domain-containing protein [Asticcacaulis sp. EMRT-3]